ncbi:MAG: hypothetical protein AAGF66_11000 [Cyanobacteria bacterium P01_H01_bin.119]
MDKALKVFFKTGRELRNLNRKASDVRLPHVESLVHEFRDILLHRAIAVEAIDVHSSPEMMADISELKALEQSEPKS